MNDKELKWDIYKYSVWLHNELNPKRNIYENELLTHQRLATLIWHFVSTDENEKLRQEIETLKEEIEKLKKEFPDESRT